jgi:hypothetical protein
VYCWKLKPNFSIKWPVFELLGKISRTSWFYAVLVIKGNILIWVTPDGTIKLNI